MRQAQQPTEQNEALAKLKTIADAIIPSLRLAWN
jgi:hypothetical protein